MGIYSYGYKASKTPAGKKIVEKVKKFFTPKGKVSPTIKSVPPFTDKKFGQFGFTKAKNPTERANIVRKRESIKRMDKVTDLRKKRQEGIKAGKEMKRMVQTGQAKNIGGTIFSKGIPEKKAKGGRVGLKVGTNPFKKETNVEKIKKTFAPKGKIKFDAKKSDLDKSGSLSPYEKRRGMAIAKAMAKRKKKV